MVTKVMIFYNGFEAALRVSGAVRILCEWIVELQYTSLLMLSL
jgi:hypothetical protein